MEKNKIITGDALEGMAALPAECVDMVLTSPPYWALRDYATEGQLGLEEDSDVFMQNLLAYFDQVKRILKKRGTLWINIGDTYSKGHKGTGGSGKATYGCFNRLQNRASFRQGLHFKMPVPNKSLCAIPFKFALEMQKRGWRLRNVIIWHKPNAMPGSAKDRFTVDFEYLFFFSKASTYYFNTQWEPVTEGSDSAYRRKLRVGKKYNNKPDWQNNYPKPARDNERIKRTTWSINTQQTKGVHTATYPEELCVTPILAGSPPGGIIFDPFMGTGTTAAVAKKYGRNYLGFELNPEYAEAARKRLGDIEWPLGSQP